MTARTRLCCIAPLLVQLSLVAQDAAPRKAVPLDPIEAILDAFKSNQVVTLPGGHAGNELHALLHPNYVTMRVNRIAMAGLPAAEADRVKRLCGGKAPETRRGRRLASRENAGRRSRESW